MRNTADSMVAYAQPLLNETDGSQADIQKALSIAQLCWNLAVLPELERNNFYVKMRESLDMNEAEFDDFRLSIVAPMIKRHHEMFPDLSRPTSGAYASSRSKEKYPGTGRNELCPCGSGKKYKRCCGR